MDGSGTADGNYRCPDLAPKHVLICLCHKAGPVDEFLHLGGHISKICGQREDDPVVMSPRP